MSREGTRLLNEAKLHWVDGYPIPTDLAMQLAALGYDVPKLENRHLKR